jgi:L,D-peptidoglycan transpeptidase YkuD (ErfK/YbiS/YcfS/YnhG family)
MPNPVVVADGTIGTLTIAAREFACALGKGGLRPADAKRESDMATPAGTWKLRAGFWRADRLATCFCATGRRSRIFAVP